MLENEENFGQSISNLEKSISSLEENIKKQTSLSRNFTISLVRGLGGAIGATVIFSIVFAFSIKVIQSIDYVPLLNNILSSKAIEDIVSNFAKLQM